MSDKEREQPDERKQAEADAKEDLELKDEDADQVRGGSGESTDAKHKGEIELGAKPRWAAK